MDEFVARINYIELNNFQNVAHGKIEMPRTQNGEPFSRRADIVGIYGQNGSGKTAVINALKYAQTLMRGQALDKDSAQRIMNGKDEASVTIAMSLNCEMLRSQAYYTFRMKRENGNTAVLSGEVLKLVHECKGEFTRKAVYMEYTPQGERPFTPRKRYDDFIRRMNECNSQDGRVNQNYSPELEIELARRIAVKENRSFIFSKDMLDIFKKYMVDEHALAILSMVNYALENIVILGEAGILLPDLQYAMFHMWKECEDSLRFHQTAFMNLGSPQIMREEQYGQFQKSFEIMNIVLDKLVPGLKADMIDLGSELDKEGKRCKRVEFVSVRNGTKIPMRYESAGIVKIVSMLQMLIEAYSNPGMFLAIDELDSCVHEYLLGELLSVMQEGKGQLLFTAHNLRPLEVLGKESVVFSTSNPENRYVRFRNIKPTNNLRDSYIRAINLGGQAEELYSPTDTVDIRRAFVRAGKAMTANG
jgi:predicted ATPase